MKKNPTATTQNVVEVQNLVKKYQSNPTPAVDDISFSVKQGEFFTFLGPNGAGKTTTLSILNTSLAKSSGEVRVAGYDIDTQSNQVRKSIGVIFQTPSLDANLTAEENIRFHTMLYGIFPFAPSFSLMPKSYQKKVMELAELLKIADAIHRPIKTFSGGMKRKLEIIRSLIHEPVVLFLDEPTTGLDPESRKNLWEYLKDVRQRHGITIFLTTHYLDEAEGSDRVCIIVGGKIVSLSTPQQLKRKLLTEQMTIDTDEKSRTKLERVLSSLNLKMTGNGPFTITLDEESKSKQHLSIQEIINKISDKSITLQTIKTHSPSLEEAYLAVLENAAAQHAPTDATQGTQS